MKCREAREKFELLKTGELPPEERENVESHVKACQECQGFLGDSERIGALLRRFVEEEISGLPEEVVVGRVRAAVRESGGRRRFSGLVKWLLPILVGAVALVAVLFYPSFETRKTREFSYRVSVERVEAVNAAVVLVERGEDIPKVIWIIEREET